MSPARYHCAILLSIGRRDQLGLPIEPFEPTVGIEIQKLKYIGGPVISGFGFRISDGCRRLELLETGNESCVVPLLALECIEDR